MKWPTATIDSIKSGDRYALVGGPFGSNLITNDYVDEGVPVIRGANLPADQPFLDEQFVFVRETKADELLPNNARPGDLIFTQRGTLGQVGLIPLSARYDRYVISQSQMKLTVDPDKADIRFVYYFFRHPGTVQAIKNRSITSGVPHINLGILKAIELPLPPVAVQSRIASILSAYDDLIENNTRRIALLEQAARLLYEEWFVRLRFPRLRQGYGGQAGRKHTRIVDGVPKGWMKTRLGDIFELQYGKALKEDNRVAGPVPVYGSSGIVGTHEVALVKGPGIIVGRKGNVGSIHWSFADFWPIDTVYYVPPDCVSLYLFHALRTVSFQSSDVAVPGLNRSYAHSISILAPADTLRRQFEEIAGPIYEQMNRLRQMNEKLRGARDLLLPRLMSGEIAA